MEKLMDDFVLKMNIRNFSKSTKTSYESELSKYLRFCEEEKQYQFGFISEISFEFNSG